jgi:hypothetical protein
LALASAHELSEEKLAHLFHSLDVMSLEKLFDFLAIRKTSPVDGSLYPKDMLVFILVQRYQHKPLLYDCIKDMSVFPTEVHDKVSRCNS